MRWNNSFYNKHSARTHATQTARNSSITKSSNSFNFYTPALLVRRVVRRVVRREVRRATQCR
jgi:hypothetical protein